MTEQEKQELERLLPKCFRALGTLELKRESDTSMVYRIDGEVHLALKVIDCTGNEEKYCCALHEWEAMMRLQGVPCAASMPRGRSAASGCLAAEYLYGRVWPCPDGCFGVARLADEQEMKPCRGGMLTYMAPEIYRNGIGNECAEGQEKKDNKKQALLSEKCLLFA